MKILVTTPTERIGWLVVRELLAPEFSVRVIVRDPARLPEEVRAQVEVIHGAMEDAATLQDALAGVEAVFLGMPMISRWKTDGRGHYERFARGAAQAIREARTPRVVTVLDPDKACVPDYEWMAGLQTMEDMLSKSGAAIRHLRSGVCEEALVLPAGPMVGRNALCHRKSKQAPSSPAATDVADAALRWLVRRDWGGVARVAVQGRAEAFQGLVTPAASRQGPGQCFWF